VRLPSIAQKAVFGIPGAGEGAKTDSSGIGTPLAESQRRAHCTAAGEGWTSFVSPT
jgi:hypothetical protein